MPYLFGHFARSLFSGPLSVPRVHQRLPVNLSRSFCRLTDRPIDQSYPFSFFFLSFSFALLDFSTNYFLILCTSFPLALSAFFLSLICLYFFCSLFFSRRSPLFLYWGQQEICVRHDRVSRLFRLRLGSFFPFFRFGLPTTAELWPTTTAGSSDLADSPALVCAVRSTTTFVVFERVHPFNFARARALCIRSHRQRLSLLHDTRRLT